LWDREFSLEQKISPMDEDAETYQEFVLAAVRRSQFPQCPIMPKVHTMLIHVQWQMKNNWGGLEDTMEDWVKHQHQWELQQCRHFCIVQDPLVCALA
jgi:hypothetical protein